MERISKISIFMLLCKYVFYVLSISYMKFWSEPVKDVSGVYTSQLITVTNWIVCYIQYIALERGGFCPKWLPYRRPKWKCLEKQWAKWPVVLHLLEGLVVCKEPGGGALDHVPTGRSGRDTSWQSYLPQPSVLQRGSRPGIRTSYRRHTTNTSNHNPIFYNDSLATFYRFLYVVSPRPIPSSVVFCSRWNGNRPDVRFVVTVYTNYSLDSLPSGSMALTLNMILILFSMLIKNNWTTWSFQFPSNFFYNSS